MNELSDYDVEEYHINKTHCVYVSLEGTHLRLQRPKSPVPRRAMWDENIPKPHFIHQRHYDLPGASVYLLPQGLVRKRVWSKKYPICISFPKANITTIKDSNQSPSDSPESSPLDKDIEFDFEIVKEDALAENILYLFARTGREKEEWFKRFSAAAAGKPLGKLNKSEVHIYLSSIQNCLRL